MGAALGFHGYGGLPAVGDHGADGVEIRQRMGEMSCQDDTGGVVGGGMVGWWAHGHLLARIYMVGLRKVWSGRLEMAVSY
jgi:hypothetical protein